MAQEIAAARRRVSIVVPVFNKVASTRRCLEALVETTPPDLFELVIVDDASSDETPRPLAGFGGNVKLVHHRENRDFVRACNDGAAMAEGEYLVFLNDDTTPTAGWLKALVEAADADPAVGAVGSKLVYPDGNLEEAGGIVFRDGSLLHFGRGDDPDRPAYGRPCAVDFCSGAALLVRRSAFERLGGFDARFAPGDYADTDLCFGLRSIGCEVVYCPASVVIHHEGVTAGTDGASGMKPNQEVNRDAFVHKWSAELARHDEPPSATGRRQSTVARAVRIAAAADPGSILVVAPALPMFDRASGCLRLFRIVELFRRERYHVTFVARNGMGQARYARALEALGVRVFSTDPERMAQLGRNVPGPRVDLAEILGERPYDVAWLSFWYAAEQYLPWIRALSPRTAVVADSVDVHWLREKREAELKRDPKLRATADETRKRELAAYGKSDLVLTVTKADADELRRAGVTPPVEVVPNVHPVHDGPRPGFDERGGLVFVGSFNHRPNVDAVLWFGREVLPRVRARLPDVPVAIVGPSPPAEVRALSDASLVVAGHVPDLEPILDGSRVSIAPLRFGAGMKGKVGEALARGLPVVTTRVGGEGMGLVDGEHALVADDAEAFAQAVVRLHEDRALWERLSVAGHRKANEAYGPERVAPALREIVARARAGGLARSVGLARTA